MFHGMTLPAGEVPLYAEASIWAIRGFEIFVLILLVHGIFRLRRIGDPLYTGAFVAATFPMLYWDWIQNQPSQFRLLYDDRFFYAFRMTDGPGWGPGEPWFIAVTYAVHIVPLAYLIMQRDVWLTEKLGQFKWPVLFVAMLPNAFAEYITVGVLKLYKYHMEPEWLTPWGSPWFNFPATSLIILLPAWCLIQSKKLLESIQYTGPGGGTVQLTPAQFGRLPFFLGVISTTCGFYFAWVIYHNFYMWSQPWLGGTPWPH